ncbi:competence protein ComG [Bacillus sp. FMQ74]|uniref:ComGF family competence protein n=1 Tax=Bacillus sp. FMQ74 TaxID=1913579 RepID=UPI0008FBB41D|nr:competence type IV pilus minor pilin ComGF [Bacillus sp. FMQ74]OIR60369.1 competence protein ComG [Bacillus sp. FMQ74]
MLISGSLATIFHLFLSRQQDHDGFTQQEWMISIEQMMNECKESQAVKTAERGSVLICTNLSGQDIRFEVYHSMVRKRVDGRGHVPILDHITAMKADIENGVVLLKIESEKKVYQTAFPVYSYLGGG